MQLTGLNQVVGLDFIIKPAALPPTINAIADPPPVDEDDGDQTLTLTGIAKGRAGGPALQIVATSSNPNVIADPTITHVDGSSTAMLSFAPVLDAVGVATITVTVTDAGANAILGDADDVAVQQSFTVTVQPVNDPPQFTMPAGLNVSQKAGPQSMAGFVTAILPGGGADELTQQLEDFSVSADASFFTSAPTIDRQGTLAFTPDPNQVGFVVVNVTLRDDGGTANGGSDETTGSFVINLLGVNDAPSISIGGDINVAPDDGLQTLPAFATAFDPGPGADDAVQLISDFVVTVDRPELFAAQPDIANDGTLTFNPLPLSDGTATVTVQVRDDGGRVNGGVDLSPPQTFQIIIEPDNPTIQSMQLADGTAQRSRIDNLVVTFDQIVTVQAGAFTLTKTDEAGSPQVALTTSSTDASGNTVVQLTFSGIYEQNGSLVDGNYELRIDGSKVTANGKMMDGGSGPGSASVDDFFRLYGDNDGSRVVDLFDFAAFRGTFGRQATDAGFLRGFDSDDNDVIDLFDFAAFRGNFGKTLAP